MNRKNTTTQNSWTTACRRGHFQKTIDQSPTGPSISAPRSSSTNNRRGPSVAAKDNKEEVTKLARPQPPEQVTVTCISKSLTNSHNMTVQEIYTTYIPHIKAELCCFTSAQRIFILKYGKLVNDRRIGWGVEEVGRGKRGHCNGQGPSKDENVQQRSTTTREKEEESWARERQSEEERQRNQESNQNLGKTGPEKGREDSGGREEGRKERV